MGYVSFREGSSKTPSDFLCLTLLKIKLQVEMTGPKPGCFLLFKNRSVGLFGSHTEEFY